MSSDAWPSEPDVPEQGWRLLGGGAAAVLVGGLLLGTFSWLGSGAGLPGSAGRWVVAVGAGALWSALIVVPGTLLVMWPLDRATRSLASGRAVLVFAGVGLVLGAVVGAALLVPVDASLLGLGLGAGTGAASGATSRLLLDRLSDSRPTVVTLSVLALVLVALGAVRS